MQTGISIPHHSIYSLPLTRLTMAKQSTLDTSFIRSFLDLEAMDATADASNDDNMEETQDFNNNNTSLHNSDDDFIMDTDEEPEEPAPMETAAPEPESSQMSMTQLLANIRRGAKSTDADVTPKRSTALTSRVRYVQLCIVSARHSHANLSLLLPDLDLPGLTGSPPRPQPLPLSPRS